MAPGDAGAGSELIIIAVPGPSTSSDLQLFFFPFWRFFFSVPYGKMKEAGGNYVFAGKGNCLRPQQLALFCFHGTILRRCFGNKSEDFYFPTFSSFLLGKRNFLFPPPFSVFIFPHLSFSQPTFISRNSGSKKRREREREREREKERERRN